MASADAVRALYVMRKLRWDAGASGAAIDAPCGEGRRGAIRFKPKPVKLLTFRLPLKRLLCATTRHHKRG